LKNLAKGKGKGVAEAEEDTELNKDNEGRMDTVDAHIT
jgi:hypothetical protein